MTYQTETGLLILDEVPPLPFPRRSSTTPTTIVNPPQKTPPCLTQGPFCERTPGRLSLKVDVVGGGYPSATATVGKEREDDVRIKTYVGLGQEETEEGLMSGAEGEGRVVQATPPRDLQT